MTWRSVPGPQVEPCLQQLQRHPHRPSKSWKGGFPWIIPSLRSESFTSKLTTCQLLPRRRSWSDRYHHPQLSILSAKIQAASQCCCLLYAQFEKQPLHVASADSRTPFSRKHWRSRSLGGMIKVILCCLFWNILFSDKFWMSQHEYGLFFICNRGKCWEARCKQRKKTMGRVLQTGHVMAVMEEKQLWRSEYLMKMFLIGCTILTPGGST